MYFSRKRKLILVDIDKMKPPSISIYIFLITKKQSGLFRQRSSQKHVWPSFSSFYIVLLLKYCGYLALPAILAGEGP